jgi:hypothetical protein
MAEMIDRLRDMAWPFRRTSPLAATAVALVILVTPAIAQNGLDQAGIALRSREALVALDRYLETWNSRSGTIWATSLHFPHVRPGPGAFELSETPQQYAAGVNFDQTLATGWHHSEWVSRDVLQVGATKVHASGSWRRYTAADAPMAGSDITYIITEQRGHWGVQARFAAGPSDLDGTARTRNAAAATAAVSAFFTAWDSHDPQALAATLHYPHVRVADGQVEIWRSAAAYLAGPEPGRQRTWHRTRVDRTTVVQTSANGSNVTVSFARLGREGKVITTDEGVFLAVQRDGAWKLQARSTMGS